jgi:hypothetical protein
MDTLSKEELSLIIRTAIHVILKWHEQEKIAPLPWNTSQLLARCGATLAVLEPDDPPFDDGGDLSI